jgi:ABC-type lipoprotein release transport system permease subunit
LSFLSNENLLIARQTFTNEFDMNTFKTLKRRYGRTTLITIGIALAIAFSTIMLSIGEAIQNSSSDIIEDTGVDLLVEPPTNLPPLILEFTTFFNIENCRTIADAMVKNNTKIQAASPWLIENLYVAKRPEQINVSDPPLFTLSECKGYVPEYDRYFSAYEVTKGSALPTTTDPFYSKGTYQDGTESTNFTHEILISEPLSELLEVDVGDILYLNQVLITNEFTNQSIQDWFENATWFRIYGIKKGNFESQNTFSIHLHLSELQFITGNYKEDKANSIYISLKDKSNRDEVKKWLENDFIYRDDITVHTPEDLLENINEFTNLFEGFSRMVVIITVLVATLFISTVLMISTRERSSEIGALRAIGISNLTITKFIFKESLVICIMSLIIGLIIGLLVSNYINDYIISTQHFLPADFKVTMITPWLIAQVTIITLIISILASLGPSYWAMHLKPVETLRNE